MNTTLTEIILHDRCGANGTWIFAVSANLIVIFTLMVIQCVMFKLCISSEDYHYIRDDLHTNVYWDMKLLKQDGRG